MTREQIRAVIVGLEQAGEGEAVASRKLCRDAVALLRRLVAGGGNSTAARCRLINVLDDLDRERKAVKS